MLNDLPTALTEQERDRLVVAEIGIDEILSIMDRYGVPNTNRFYRALAEISGVMSEQMLLADGPFKREARLRSIRDRLTEAFPHARCTLKQRPEAMWQPIETAPKDRLIIVWAPPREGLSGFVTCCKWHDDAGFCVDEIRVPTHWKPMPLPPTDQ